ncbi:MAG: HNH endonuclease signature motif containing protein [Acidimicrobiia bacterium]|nr:MAG: HNH endonuclease signature motif containing protein [Acidimicrobiia bacterium]
MCYQTSVLDRALVSDEGGGLDVPGTDLETIEDHIRQLPDADLKQAAVDARRMIDRSHAELALLVREIDRRDLPELYEHLSTTGWLKRHTRVTAAEASGTVKTARAIPHMPRVLERALAGEVPARSMQLIAQARDRHRDEFVEHEEVFADIATYLSVKDMQRAISHWEQQIDYAQSLEDAQHAEGLRSVYLSQTIDGVGYLSGTLTAEQFQTVRSALDAHGDPANLDEDDHRTPAQRRADSLVDIHRFWLDHNTDVQTSGGEKPHITVTVDYRQLTGRLERLPELNGVAVTPESVRRMACDASIIPMVLGSDSEPLDVGRKTRTIPPAIRRAIEQIHDGCAWPGCDAPLSWCDIHHKVHWADGGETSVHNCAPYCRKHHIVVHSDDVAGRDPPRRA